MKVLPAGPRAVLVECADGDEVAAWHAELVRRRGTGELRAVELVPAARTILLDGVDDPAGLAGELARWRPATGVVAAVDAGHVTIACVYDGPDLEVVAGLWGTDVAGVVAEHTGTEFRVAFCGFSPGFGYLTGLPAERAVPRRASPRARVAAGSVGLAGEYTGVYPSASPGGWQLIGRTEVTLFDPDRDPPALLTPSTTVRFTAA